jgi:16S rRNA (cytidine1402-2'-O)-methyltransferase
LADLHEVCGDRRVTVCRELTKVHEEVWRGRLGEAAGVFGERPVRGEVVVVLEGRRPSGPKEGELAEAVRSRLAAGDSPRQAADALAGALGMPRRVVYAEALAQRDVSAGGRPGHPSGTPRGRL